MRRWIAIFLLVFLPLQSAWAAAAAYCQHEEDPTTLHVGHHAHAHAGAEADAHHDNGPAADHPDCQVCHAAVAAVSDHVAPALQSGIDSPFPGGERALPASPITLPERPNWLRLA